MDMYNPLIEGSKVVTGVSAPNEAYFATGLHLAIMEDIAKGAVPATVVAAVPASGYAGQIIYILDTGLAAGIAPAGNAQLLRWDTSLVTPAWVSMLGSAGNAQWAKYFIASLGNVPSQSIVFNQASASATWSIAHNFGTRPIVQVYDATFANLLAPTNIAHPTINSCVISFGSALAGNAILVTTTTAGVSAGSPFAGMSSN